MLCSWTQNQQQLYSYLSCSFFTLILIKSPQQTQAPSLPRYWKRLFVLCCFELNNFRCLTCNSQIFNSQLATRRFLTRNSQTRNSQTHRLANSQVSTRMHDELWLLEVFQFTRGTATSCYIADSHFPAWFKENLSYFLFENTRKSAFSLLLWVCGEQIMSFISLGKWYM